MGTTMSTNFVQTELETGIQLSQNEFIKDYGKYAMKYSYVNPLGKQSSHNMFIYFVILIFIVVGAAVLHTHVKEKNKKKGITTMSKSFLGLSILFLIFIGLGAAFVYIMYKIQYFQWFISLPMAAKAALAMISATQSILIPDKTN